MLSVVTDDSYRLGANEPKSTSAVSRRWCVGLPVVNRDSLPVVEFGGVQAAVIPGPRETTLASLSGGRKEGEDGESRSEHTGEGNARDERTDKGKVTGEGCCSGVIWSWVIRD